MNRRRHALHRQRGLSLVEILVAVVILSIGLLGLAGLQANSMRASQGSLYRAQAATLVADLAERMRTNLGDARNYQHALGAAPPAGTHVRAADLADWLARVAALPAGRGAVSVNPSNTLVTITVEWDDSRAGGPVNARHTTETRLWNN
ncbi:MAG: type IV pilus modification protein PilV [Burkholderiaceae bacterium]